MKKALKTIGCILLAVVLLAAAYLAYVFIAYHRIEDNQRLNIAQANVRQVETETAYKVVSWNIGFGAYESDYGFFMDGGKQSWAWSEDRLNINLENIGSFLNEQDAAILLVQEVDWDSTRTYHVDELQKLKESLREKHSYDSTFAVNYDSPFLFYPFLQPHGRSRSGIATFADFEITDAIRRSLPIDKGLTRFLDLDRCYSVSRIPVENGKELCVYNFHLSAYSADGSIADEQMELLIADMQSEYEKGNYVIGGGDFNKDLLGDSSRYFGVSTEGYTWSQPIRMDIIEKSGIQLVPPLEQDKPVASCRNADGPIRDGQLRLTVDGFLVSPNVSVSQEKVIDLEFAYSDHNPVQMEIMLEP